VLGNYQFRVLQKDTSPIFRLYYPKTYDCANFIN